MKRARGPDGAAIGRSHTNPLFDTREYDIKFTDGTSERYAVNIIAENMFAQVDEEGNQFQILSEITDHMADGSTIPIADGKVKNGKRHGKGIRSLLTDGNYLYCGRTVHQAGSISKT